MEVTGFSDGSFGPNNDRSSHVGFMIFLTDKKTTTRFSPTTQVKSQGESLDLY